MKKCYSVVNPIIRKRSVPIKTRLEILKKECHLEINHNSAVTALIASPDSSYIIMGCDNGIILVWNTSTKQKELELKRHIGYIRALAISHDNKILLSGGYDDSVVLWELSNRSMKKEFRRPMHEFQPDNTGVKFLAVSNKSKYIAVVYINGLCRIWANDENHSVVGSFDNILELVFWLDDKYLILSASDKLFSVWKFIIRENTDEHS